MRAGLVSNLNHAGAAAVSGWLRNHPGQGGPVAVSARDHGSYGGHGVFAAAAATAAGWLLLFVVLLVLPPASQPRRDERAALIRLLPLVAMRLPRMVIRP
jgi:hypothetical protein